MENRTCSNCGSATTYIRRDGRRQWNSYNDGWLCNSCYCKLVLNPKWSNINNKRRIKFKDTIIRVDKNPRKGKCENCGLKIGDSYINHKGQIVILKHTQMHHEQYHDDDPLKDTMELCVKCHDKTMRGGHIS